MLWENFILPGLTILATAFTTVGTTAWWLRGTLDDRDQKLLNLMSDHERNDVERFNVVHAKITASMHDIVVTFGDTGRGLREQMHLMDLAAEREKTANLREFIRRDSFFEVIRGINTRFDRIDERLGMKRPDGDGAAG